MKGKKICALLLLVLAIIVVVIGCSSSENNNVTPVLVGIIPDDLNLPSVVIDAAIDWAKGDFEGYRDIGLSFQRENGAEFDNWRLDRIEHVYDYAHLNTAVYQFEWRIHTTTPDKIILTGGMELDNDGWLLDTYPDSWYLLFNTSTEEYEYLFANDCIPGDEIFTQDMLDRLGA